MKETNHLTIKYELNDTILRKTSMYTCVHVYASSAVHSDCDVGLERARIMGLYQKFIQKICQPLSSRGCDAISQIYNYRAKFNTGGTVWTLTQLRMSKSHTFRPRKQNCYQISQTFYILYDAGPCSQNSPRTDIGKKSTSLLVAIASTTSLVNVLPTPDVPINTVGLIA